MRSRCWRLTTSSAAMAPDPWFGTGSHLKPRANSVLMNVLIVADLTRLDGVEIGPVSDYIAMLALTQSRSLDACNPLPSILDRWASDCQGREAPASLTDGDIAFLEALYASDLSTSVDAGRYRVVKGMAGSVSVPSAGPSATSLIRAPAGSDPAAPKTGGSN